MATTNDQHLGVGRVDVLSSLLLPADGPDHVPINGRKLGELLQPLGGSMHGIDLPAILGEDGVDDCRSDNDFCLKGDNKLQLGIVGVGAGDLRSRGKELEVGCLCCREKIGSGPEDGRCEVEGVVIPREGKFVSPNS